MISALPTFLLFIQVLLLGQIYAPMAKTDTVMAQNTPLHASTTPGQHSKNAKAITDAEAPLRSHASQMHESGPNTTPSHQLQDLPTHQHEWQHQPYSFAEPYYASLQPEAYCTSLQPESPASPPASPNEVASTGHPALEEEEEEERQEPFLQPESPLTAPSEQASEEETRETRFRREGGGPRDREARQHEKYLEVCGAKGEARPAWELLPDGSFACHVSELLFSTATQSVHHMERDSYRKRLAASGLSEDPHVIATIEQMCADEKEALNNQKHATIKQRNAAHQELRVEASRLNKAKRKLEHDVMVTKTRMDKMQLQHERQLQYLTTTFQQKMDKMYRQLINRNQTACPKESANEPQIRLEFKRTPQGLHSTASVSSCTASPMAAGGQTRWAEAAADFEAALGPCTPTSPPAARWRRDPPSGAELAKQKNRRGSVQAWGPNAPSGQTHSGPKSAALPGQRVPLPTASGTAAPGAGLQAAHAWTPPTHIPPEIAPLVPFMYAMFQPQAFGMGANPHQSALARSAPPPHPSTPAGGHPPPPPPPPPPPAFASGAPPSHAPMPQFPPTGAPVAVPPPSARFAPPTSSHEGGRVLARASVRQGSRGGTLHRSQALADVQGSACGPTTRTLKPPPTGNRTTGRQRHQEFRR